MLVEDSREEEFGYIVVGPKGQVHLMGKEAQGFVKIGEPIDENAYIPQTLKVTLPFRLTAPLITMVEVTKRCNLNCGHCYIDAGEPRKNEMDTEEIYSVLDELKKNKVFHVLITGGEPFTRSDIVDIINYGAESGLFVLVVTNGVLLTDAIVSRIRKGRVGFALSFLGGFRNGITNDEAFDLLKKRITLLKSHGFSAECWFCATKENVDNMYDVGTWCLNNDVLILYDDALLIGRCKENRSLILDVSDVDRNLKGFEVIIDGSTKSYDRIREEASKNEDPFDVCYALERTVGACKGGRSFAYICSNGDVYPCSNCAAENLFFAGTLREHSFSHIWENSFKGIRSFTWDDFKGCETCELKENYVKGQFCKMRCPPLSKSLYNDLMYCGASEYTKAVSKAKLERLPEWYLGGST